MIAILGAGKMGEALLSGLLRSGHDPADVVVSDARPERCAELLESYGVKALANTEAAAAAETLLLAVKPQDMPALLAEIAPHAGAVRLAISIAAGVRTATIEEWLPATPVVRVMPNTPMLVGQGASVISAGSHATEEHLVQTEELLRAVSTVTRVPERHQDAATALSGSGPAYVYYLAESMIDAGVTMGLPRATARELTLQTLTGAATLMRDSGEHPAVLREAVTSPGGTTAAAVAELERRGVRSAVLDAIVKARDRGAELAGE
ncbi:pyrroline-5-carboxylate reductase [Allonocardiopsis opalescens]|uniref:Pyrroline-5-carboxylate reductase n=1 Tax=Allonocardiopsis opalescens TaxID=1144618 RepID=A0A2T0Q7S1_9ACTN|nr:pyrroline-5-carboxylate reductase [Allonocardiopsis opalescens]PRX99869.1 pyrroline-5-carboxylate reductase [Allonocardiopsis opalescens]